MSLFWHTKEPPPEHTKFEEPVQTGVPVTVNGTGLRGQLVAVPLLVVTVQPFPAMTVVPAPTGEMSDPLTVAIAELPETNTPPDQPDGAPATAIPSTEIGFGATLGIPLGQGGGGHGQFVEFRVTEVCAVPS